MSTRRRVAAAAFGICTLFAYVALPPDAAGAVTVGSEIAVSDPVMQTQTRAFGQLNFDMVFDGTRWFVVWGEDRGGTSMSWGDGLVLTGACPTETASRSPPA